MSITALPVLVAPIERTEVVQIPTTSGYLVPVSGAHLIDSTGRLHVLSGTNLHHVQSGGAPVVHDGLTYVPTYHTVNTSQPSVYKGSRAQVNYLTPTASSSGHRTSYPPSSSSVHHTSYPTASSSGYPPSPSSSSSSKSVVHGDQVGHKGHSFKYNPNYKASGRFQFGGNKTVIHQTVAPSASSETSHSFDSKKSSKASKKTSHSSEAKAPKKTSHSPETKASKKTSHSPEAKASKKTSHSPEAKASKKTSHSPETKASHSKPLSPAKKTSHSPGANAAHPKPSSPSKKSSHSPATKASHSKPSASKPSRSRRQPSSLKTARASTTGGNHTVRRKRPASVRARISDKFVFDAYKEKYNEYFGAGTSRDIFYATASTVERVRTNPGAFFFPLMLDNIMKKGNLLECLIVPESEVVPRSQGEMQETGKVASREGCRMSSRTLDFFFSPDMEFTFGQIYTFTFNEKAFTIHNETDEEEHHEDETFGNDYSRFSIFLEEEEEVDLWEGESSYVVRVNLYDDVIDSEMIENVPVPYVTLEFMRVNRLNTYALKEMVVTLDFEPTNAETVVYNRGIDVLPLLTNESVYVARRSDYQETAKFHEDVVRAIYDAYDEITDAPEKAKDFFWCFESNVGSASSNPAAVDKSRVLWGDIFDTMLCFTLGTLLKYHNNLKYLYDPVFLRSWIEKIPGDGPLLVAEIERLYRAFYAKSGHVIEYTFPSLYQVLRHTTGLPAVPHIDVADVQREHVRIVHATLTGQAATSQDYNSQSAPPFGTLIGALQQFESAVNAVDTIVGDPGNFCEVLLLHAFCMSYIRTSPLNYAFENIKDTFSVHLTSLLGQHADLDLPTSLATNVVISTFKDLVSYVKKLHIENNKDVYREFTLSDMLSRPTYYQPDTNLSKAFGWSCIRARNNIDVFFASSAQYVDLDNTLVVFIPRLNFWGVFHENSTVYGTSLVMDSFDTLKRIVSIVEKIPLTPETVQSIDYLSQSIYARHHEVLKFNDKSKIDTKLVYYDIFDNPITGLQTELELVTNQEGQSAIHIQFGRGAVIPLVPSEEGLSGEYYRGDNAYSTDVITITDAYLRFGGRLYLPKAYNMGFREKVEGAKKQRDSITRKDSHRAFSTRMSMRDKETPSRIDMQKMYTGQSYLPSSPAEARVPQKIGGPLGLGLGLATGALAGAALTGAALSGPGYQYYPYAAWDGMLYAPGYGYYFPWGSSYYYNAPVFVGRPRAGIAYGGRRRFYGGHGGFHGGHGGRGGGGGFHGGRGGRGGGGHH